MRVSVVIPALNEAGNIGRLVEETYAAVPLSVLGRGDRRRRRQRPTRPQPRSRRADRQRNRFAGLRYLRHDERCGQSAARALGHPRGHEPRHRHHGRRRPERSRATSRGSSSGSAPPGDQRPRPRRRRSYRAQGDGLQAVGLARGQLDPRQACCATTAPTTGCGIKVYWREAFLRLPYLHRHAPLSAGPVPDLRPRGGLRAGQRPAAARRRLQVQQSRSRPASASMTSSASAGCAGARMVPSDRRGRRPKPAARDRHRHAPEAVERRRGAISAGDKS